MSYQFQKHQNFLVFSIVCTFIILVTNYFPTINETIDLGVNDARSYLVFFTSGYDFSNKDFWELPSHHIDRWPIFLAAKEISLLVPFNFEFTLRIIVVIVLLIILYQISSLEFNFSLKVIISLFIIFSPYSFRFFLFAPTALSDLIFYLGSFLLFIGIKKGNIFTSSLGIIIGILSKQTAILFIPIFFIFFYFNLINQKKLAYFLALLFITILLKKFLEFQLFGAIIDPPDLVHILGFLNYFEELEASYYSLRGLALSLLLLSPLIIFLKYIHKKNLYIFFAIFFAISSQPILGSSGGNMTRLITFSYPAIIFLFSGFERPSSKESIIFSTLVIFSSLHHNYSVLHDSKFLFGIIIIVAFLFSLTYSIFNMNHKPSK